MARRIIASLLICLAAVVIAGAPLAWGQYGSQGKVNITVLDPDGRVVPGAQLELQDVATNYVRKAVTQETGTYTFINLSIGTYKLKVSKEGFQTQAFDSVLVQATKTTDISITLKVGTASETVEVQGTAAPLVETTTSAIGTIVNLKQIEALPLSGRNLTNLAQLTPGYTGTWNGLPTIAQGNNIDGVIGSPSRMKYGGNSFPVAVPRIENIEEMSVQTDQLDLNQGFGQATMQINFVTRRGTNAFHGRVYEDHRNSALNANTWNNNALGRKKNRLILNEFGGSVGGPILKDKLFFFGSFSMSKQPQTVNNTNYVFTSDAQNGIFRYTGGRSVNLYTLAANYNAANGTNLPTGPNQAISNQLATINKAGLLGTLSANVDPNRQTLTWATPNPTTYYYPTFRVDYDASSAVRMNLAFNETKRTTPAQGSWPTFPGTDFANQSAGTAATNYSASYGVDWTITPTLINQFKAGYLYNVNRLGYNAGSGYASNPTVWWGYPGDTANHMSGQMYYLPLVSYYPIINGGDTLSWQHGKHNASFGFSMYREQDHYWNPPQGFPEYTLGLATGDPALNAFTRGATGTIPGATSTELNRARKLYAILTGRLSEVAGENAYDPKTGAYLPAGTIGHYDLNELSKAWALFFQDSFRLRPNLTVNYGLRWDFTGDNYDKTKAYHNVAPASIFGPSGIGNLFNPGSLLGNLNPAIVARNHVYNPWNVAPQPALGIAWSPSAKEGFLNKLTGGQGDTVIRAGFSLRNFTEPYQYYWDQASNYGSFFYQNFSLSANNSGQEGTFAPGSLALGQTLPAYYYAPTTYQQQAYLSQFTFIGGINGVNGMDSHIKQPYTESWNFGIQRKLGESRALELRYNGNRVVHMWLNINPNEVNIFENKFLSEFKNAQANLAINRAHGIESFANNGYAGQVNLPILTTAFAGEAAGGPGVPLEDFSNADFIDQLDTGQAGNMANTLSNIEGTTLYYCNLVGAAFAPCQDNVGFTGPGNYPINFFQANPYAGGGIGYMTAIGYSTYHALQVEFRQRPWHGIALNANYTWSKNLGVSTANDWTAWFPIYTLRDIHMNYGPTNYDRRNVIRVNGTVDLPFGHGRAFMNRTGVLDRVVGGWTVGFITTYQTGLPIRLTSGYGTYNDSADSGLVWSGASPSDLQNAVGVFRNAGTPAGQVAVINPKYLSLGAGANSTYINPNTDPGTVGQINYLYGPHGFYTDMSLSKSFRITERTRFVFQSEFLNVFNHPVFANSSNFMSGNIFSGNFGVGGVSNSPRNIEFRANIEF